MDYLGERAWIFGDWVKGAIIKYWKDAAKITNQVPTICQQSALSNHFAARFTLPQGFPMPRSCASLQSSPGQEIQDSGCYGREAEELLAAG